ncbi:hypothetical protein [Costertonia aggregata]|uniref:Uncharacterized protein n=1 Tax=Costertonia aggregata TaxID=343403 RepID=A0A7H9ATS2_9FLAO|nr:hypothetical protein [Costertonia aggregata]QLG46797.1 hypothetical protein HYG79_16045 [Costertonia aggregata]
MKITDESEAAAGDDESDAIWSPWEYGVPDLKTFLAEIKKDKYLYIKNNILTTTNLIDFKKT